MNMAMLSIIFLAGAITLGFFRKVNVGLISIAGAFILGHILGLGDKKIVAGFNAGLFVTLMGVTFLFSILTSNGTIERVAKRMVMLAGRRNWLIPVVMFLVGYVMTAIGPGAIPMLAIMPAFAIPVAVARGFNPIMMALIADFGVFSGRMSPITPEGILVYELLGQAGIVQDVTGALIFNQTITGIVCALLAYGYYRGYKVKNLTEGSGERVEDLKLNRGQMISLLGLIITVVMVVAFKFNVGLVAFTVGTVLLCLRLADEGKSIKGIPWGVLIMVSGVGTLMTLVINAKGIELMSNFLALFMNSWTASAVMGVTGGVMSWFSSGLGVVFPTLIPTVSSIAQMVGGHVNPVELASLVVIGGTFTGVSPFSTTGGLILATVMTEEGGSNGGGDKIKQNKVFIELLIWSVITLVVLTGLALTQVYSLAL